MSIEFPSFSVEPGKPIIWNSNPLTGAALNDLLFAARKASKFTEGDTVKTARERWIQASRLLNAVIDRLPSMDDLRTAIHEIPPTPSPPRPFVLEEPEPDSRYNFISSYVEELNNWKAKKRNHEKGIEAYHEKLIFYDRQLPDFQKGVETWNKLGGEEGILRTRRIRLKLSDVLQDIERNLNNPYDGMLDLPFEFLPAGLWSSQVLIPHLGKNGWDVTKIVPDRIDHLISLKPQMIFKDNIHRGYHNYLLFLFEKDGPVALETPIHGNATYVLHRNWRELCRRSKGDLIHHPDVTRIIHHDMDSWRHEVFRTLKVKAPIHSNGY